MDCSHTDAPQRIPDLFRTIDVLAHVGVHGDGHTVAHEEPVQLRALRTGCSKAWQLALLCAYPDTIGGAESEEFIVRRQNCNVGLPPCQPP